MGILAFDQHGKILGMVEGPTLQELAKDPAAFVRGYDGGGLKISMVRFNLRRAKVPA